MDLIDRARPWTARVGGQSINRDPGRRSDIVQHDKLGVSMDPGGPWAITVQAHVSRINAVTSRSACSGPQPGVTRVTQV